MDWLIIIGGIIAKKKGQLVFSDYGVEKLIIQYEDVGSISLKTKTWLWSWDNPYVLENVKSEIVKIRQYGIKRNFKKLMLPKWKAELVDGWEMAGISAFLLKAKGAYRAPFGNEQYSFKIFKKINWVAGN